MRMDEDGNVVPGKMVDMVVEGQDVYIVSWPGTNLEPLCHGSRYATPLARVGWESSVSVERDRGGPIDQEDVVPVPCDRAIWKSG